MKTVFSTPKLALFFLAVLGLALLMEPRNEILHWVALITFTGFCFLFWRMMPKAEKAIETEKNLAETSQLLKNSENELSIAFDSAIMGMSLLSSAQEQLETMAYHDPLTGLANRNKLEENLQQLVASAQRRQAKFAVIILDLDHFKNINDTIGHHAGDLLLKVVGERLKNSVRASDLVVRLGGDEFVVVISDFKLTEEVAVVAQKILTLLVKPVMAKEHELYVTSSIGISVYPFDGEDIKTLLRNADLALYRAKETGRNNYQFCTPEMTARTHEKMAKQQALTQGIARNECYLYYQPKLDLNTHKICGVEALIRWQSKEFGYLPPDEIIHLAEDSGLIIALGDWVLKNACEQLKRWHQAGFSSLTLSINLSTKQFKQSDFVSKVEAVLQQCGVSPEFLEFEITENLILQDPETTLRTLQKLKTMGIRISIDDFGTGYSSLSYLKSFNVDKIKIDKTFIQRLDLDETSRAIVSAIIMMANKLKVKTIAEGVETKAHYDFLAYEKCSEIQGYLLSKPLPASDIIGFLTKSPSEVKLS